MPGRRGGHEEWPGGSKVEECLSNFRPRCHLCLDVDLSLGKFVLLQRPVAAVKPRARCDSRTVPPAKLKHKMFHWDIMLQPFCKHTNKFICSPKCCNIIYCKLILGNNLLSYLFVRIFHTRDFTATNNILSDIFFKSANTILSLSSCSVKCCTHEISFMQARREYAKFRGRRVNDECVGPFLSVWSPGGPCTTRLM